MRNRLPFLTVLVWAACAPSTAPAPHAALAALPSMHLLTMEGATTDLASVLGGRPALVSLWAPWCDGCVAEIEPLKRLDAQTRGARQGGLVVAIAVGETREGAAEYARAKGMTYARLVDEEFQLADALGERRIPATLVVDRAGRIVYRGGALDAAALAAFRAATAGSADEP